MEETIIKEQNKLWVKIEKLNTKTKKYQEKNHFKKCLKAYTTILNLIKLSEDVKLKSIYGDTLLLTGELLYQNEKYHEAIPYLLESINIKLDLNIELKDLNQIYEKLYTCYLKLGQKEGIFYYGQLLLERNDLNLVTKCQINGTLGRFYLMNYLEQLNVSSLLKGISYSQAATKLYEASGYENKLDYINVLYDSGEISYYLEDYELAIHYFEKIINEFDVYEIPNQLLFGLYNHLSEIYKNLGFRDTELYYIRRLKEIEDL